MRKPEYIIQIAADTIAQLRSVDVFRVLDNCSDEERKPMARYIVANRPELTGEVATYWSGDTLPLETHNQDDDCVVGPDALCIICHVSHDQRCDLCGGAGFHEADCDGGRTRIGNTPTCETCGQAECVCEDNEDFGNEQRAAGARVAVFAFANHCGEIGEEGNKDLLQQNIVDLLADLAHLCDREDLSLSGMLSTAQMHYEEETTNTGRQFEEYTPSPAHVTGLKEQLGAAFPWLTTDEEDQISGADTIDQLQQFYDNLEGANG